MTIGSARDLEGQLIALVGGTGFVGRHVAQELLARGARLRLLSRHPEQAYRIKPLGGLGQTQTVAADVTKPHTLEVALTGVDAVVNLVGAFAGKLDAVQGSGIGELARIARAQGARAFVHVSAIGADASSSIAYARTKAEGEAAVLAAFPEATILRPSVLFGSDDAFVNLFAGLVSTFPVVPVFAPQARLQPLFVDDAALAIATVLVGNLTAPGRFTGQTYEIAGPEAISVIDLNRRIAEAAGREPLFLELPDAVSSLLAALPGVPITGAQLALLRQGNVASGALPGLAALGIAPRPIGLFLDRWLVRYRKHGRFGAVA